jgi:hypothetical protein
MRTSPIPTDPNTIALVARINAELEAGVARVMRARAGIADTEPLCSPQLWISEWCGYSSAWESPDDDMRVPVCADLAPDTPDPECGCGNDCDDFHDLIHQSNFDLDWFAASDGHDHSPDTNPCEMCALWWSGKIAAVIADLFDDPSVTALLT